MHPPHPAPALVHFLTPAKSLASPDLMQAEIWPLVTLWHEQTWVSSSRSAPSSSPLFFPTMKSAGATSRAFFFLVIATSLTVQAYPRGR